MKISDRFRNDSTILFAITSSLPCATCIFFGNSGIHHVRECEYSDELPMY